ALAQVEPAIRRAADGPADVLQRFTGDPGRRAIALLARVDHAVPAAWRRSRLASRGIELASVGTPQLAAGEAKTRAGRIPQARSVARLAPCNVDVAVAAPFPMRDERTRGAAAEADRAAQGVASRRQGRGEARASAHALAAWE